MINNTFIKSNISKKSGFVVFCFLVICMFQSFALFQPDSTLNHFSFKGTFVALSFFITVFVFVYSSKSFTVSSESILFSLSIIAFWFLELVHAYGKLTFLSSTVYLVFIPFLFLNKSIQERVFDAFSKVFFWVSLIGIVAFLVYIFNIVPPPSLVDYYEEDMISSSYANYYLSYLFVTDYGLTRLCGLFNEPGFFGTLAILLLISNRFQINKFSFVILIASLFTFSLAFVALLLIYFVLKAVFYRKFKFLFFILLLGGAVLYLTTIEVDDSNITFLLNRLFPEDGGLIKDNRATDELDKAWKIFINDSEKYLFGYGQHFDVRGASYKVMVMKHGFIGIAFVFIPFILACFKLTKKNKDCIIFILVFIISIYQRPQIFNLAYFVILTGGLLHLKSAQSQALMRTKKEKEYKIATT